MSKIWAAIHGVTGCMWGYVLVGMLWEIFTKGNLVDTPDKGRNFDTSFVVFFLALLILTCASALRALFLETEPRP